MRRLRILYGVQGTGNGHISRSREIIRRLKVDGHEVRVILSGRPASDLWGLDVFAPYTVLKGLTFSSSRGRLRVLDTMRGLDFGRLFADVRHYDARGLDLVVTDFEPVSARIARRHRLPCIGVGHQYAFGPGVPVAGFDPVAKLILRHFAPAGIRVGLHWHHFGLPILPPVVPASLPTARPGDPRTVLVYLPFEEVEDILRLVAPFQDHRFRIFHGKLAPRDVGHASLRPCTRAIFLEELVSCGAVLCNAGFELASEAMHLGRRILVKPLSGQYEQLANAKALVELDLGMAMETLDQDRLAAFLASGMPAPVQRFPDVASMIAEWLGAGDWNDVGNLSKLAWQATSASLPVAAAG